MDRAPIFIRGCKKKKKSLQEQLEKQEATGKCGPRGVRKLREVGRLVVIDAAEPSCIKSIEKCLLKMSIGSVLMIQQLVGTAMNLLT